MSVIGPLLGRKRTYRRSQLTFENDRGRVKTKSDLVVMPSGRQIFAFFALRVTVEPKIPGAVIPRGVFTQPGSFSTDWSNPR